MRDCNLPVGCIGFSIVVIELKELVKKIPVVKSYKKDDNKIHCYKFLIFVY